MKKSKVIIKNQNKGHWIENFVVDDPMHLLREKDKQGYISYQFERLTLLIKHIIYGSPTSKE